MHDFMRIRHLTLKISYSDLLPYLSGQQHQILDVSLLSHLISSAHAVDAMVSMLKPLMNIALDLQHQYQQSLQPIMSKVSKSFTSLPEELLPIIFELAVFAEGDNGAKQAIKLTHVFRTFKRIALA